MHQSRIARAILVATGMLGYFLGAPCALATEEKTAILYASATIDGRGNVERLGNALPMRDLKSKGQVVEVFYDSCIVTGEIKFSETKRNTRLHDDLSLIAKKLTDGRADERCGFSRKTYTLKHVRAVLVVTATKVGGEEIESKTVITGPQEHFSLGLDLPISNRKTLKYDSTSKSLLPKDEAPQLYLSLNLSPGDILMPPEESSGMDRIEFKLMVAASSRPLNSYGVGLGYKMPKIGALDLNGFSVFGGYFVAKQDAIVGAAVLPEQSNKRAWRFGISYDLATALNWVKL